jgi:hypothetical protein
MSSKNRKSKKEMEKEEEDFYLNDPFEDYSQSDIIKDTQNKRKVDFINRMQQEVVNRKRQEALNNLKENPIINNSPINCCDQIEILKNDIDFIINKYESILKAHNISGGNKKTFRRKNKRKTTKRKTTKRSRSNK